MEIAKDIVSDVDFDSLNDAINYLYDDKTCFNCKHNKDKVCDLRCVSVGIFDSCGNHEVDIKYSDNEL